MKKWLAAGLAAALALGCIGMTAEADEGDLVQLKVKNKEWKDTQVFMREGRVFADPKALEKGGEWKISSDGGAYFVSVPTGKKGELSSVRLPVGEDGLADLTFFADQAGLSYKLNEKKKEIKFSKGKEEKKKTGKGSVLIMWDPDENFDPSQPFFTEKAGSRVISPTWGTHREMAAGRRYFPISYIENAEKAGVSVMPLVNNDFDPDSTAALLRDEAGKEKFYQGLAAYAEVYGLSGWNIDFENMDPKDKDRFTDFIKDLSDRLHKNGKKVSVDITVISDDPNSFWNSGYDRKALAKYADYEILMGYDQTAGGSRHAGPVSAYNWLDASLPKLLKEIPANQLVLGLPFYTRVWTGEDGGVNSDVLTQMYTDDFTRRHKIMPQWLDKERQFYADWNESGVRKRVWFEEGRSLAEKLSLIEKYKLAGAAFWRYGFENGDLYGQMEDALKHS